MPGQCTKGGRVAVKPRESVPVHEVFFALRGATPPVVFSDKHSLRVRTMTVSIGFLGGGNMAGAMIGGLLAQGWSPAQIRVSDIDPAARSRLADSFGVSVSDSAIDLVDSVSCVVLAVKPQVLRPLCHSISDAAPSRLVVSIAAGIRTRDLSRWLGSTRRIVRVMPNTPALLRAGISAAYALPEVSQHDRETVDSLLTSMGKAIWLNDEALMDGVTAVSGSGPAYVFYLIEAMEEAARQLGFDEAQSTLLSRETVLGAARLADASLESSAVLRAGVTSRGGTTERAIATLDQRQAKAHLVEAILEAAKRSRELGDELGSDKK